MKVSAKSSNFEPHDDGTFIGALVDITPLEKRETQFGTKEEFRLVFETNAPTREVERDGEKIDQPQCVWSRSFTPTLSDRAALRKFLRQWFGRDLTKEELEEFDMEELMGKTANLVIIHEESEGKTYANIAAITPIKGKCDFAPSGTFTRKKDREQKQGSEANHRKAAAPSSAKSEPKRESVDDTQAGEDWASVKVHVGANNGIELRDLDEEAISKLVDRWLPAHKANKKPTADDKRLAAALVHAQAAIAGAQAPADDY